MNKPEISDDWLKNQDKIPDSSVPRRTAQVSNPASLGRISESRQLAIQQAKREKSGSI